VSDESRSVRKVIPGNRREQLSALKQQQIEIEKQRVFGRFFGRTVFIALCCITAIFGAELRLLALTFGAPAVGLALFWYLDSRAQLVSLRVTIYRIAQLEETMNRRTDEDDFIRFQYGNQIDRPLRVLRSSEPILWLSLVWVVIFAVITIRI
jgi:hypothetical protein